MKIKGKFVITVILMLVILSSCFVALATGLDDKIEAPREDGVFGAVQKLVKDIRNLVVWISGPAALIGVGFGALSMKFAGGGDDSNQKRAMGKKAITSSIIAWVAINGLMMLLTAVSGYIT